MNVVDSSRSSHTRVGEGFGRKGRGEHRGRYGGAPNSIDCPMIYGIPPHSISAPMEWSSEEELECRG